MLRHGFITYGNNYADSRPGANPPVLPFTYSSLLFLLDFRFKINYALLAYVGYTTLLRIILSRN